MRRPVIPVTVEMVAAAYTKERLRRSQQTGLDPWRSEWARSSQLPPDGDWITWLIMAGRGFGKTRAGAEFVREKVMAGHARRIALVGPTAADVRDTMIEGPSGLLAVCEAYKFRAIYQPTRRRVIFENGAKAITYSAEEPKRLRGPQHDLAWSDEVAAWSYPDAWDQLQFGLRMKGPGGEEPQQVATTTPKPCHTLRGILKAPKLAVTTGTSYENLDNLADAFITTVIKPYEGTRLGRQELLAELLEDYEGALWSLGMIERYRVADAPRNPAGKIDLTRIVLAVDPATTYGPGSDETSYAVMGIDQRRHLYLLETWGDRAAPAVWARAVVEAAVRWEIDYLIAEGNQGGEMVRNTILAAVRELRDASPERRIPQPAIQLLHAKRAKAARAEPVAQAYEQGRVHHVGLLNGSNPEIAQLKATEDQMVQFPVASEHDDRVDALVHVASELLTLQDRTMRAA